MFTSKFDWKMFLLILDIQFAEMAIHCTVYVKLQSDNWYVVSYVVLFIFCNCMRKYGLFSWAGLES